MNLSVSWENMSFFYSLPMTYGDSNKENLFLQMSVIIWQLTATSICERYLLRLSHENISYWFTTQSSLHALAWPAILKGKVTWSLGNHQWWTYWTVQPWKMGKRNVHMYKN